MAERVCYEVRIDARLRRLRSGQLAVPARLSPAAEVAPTPAPAASPTAIASPPEGRGERPDRQETPAAMTLPVDDPLAKGQPGPPVHRIRLRRDGTRPLVFDGVPVIELRRRIGVPGTDAPAAELALAFFLGPGPDDLVAQVVCRPLGVAALRPIHRAERISDAGEFARFLAGFRPDQSVPLPRGEDLDCRDAALSVATALRRGATAMLRFCEKAGLDRRKETTCPT